MHSNYLNLPLHSLQAVNTTEPAALWFCFYNAISVYLGQATSKWEEMDRPLIPMIIVQSRSCFEDVYIYWNLSACLNKQF